MIWVVAALTVVVAVLTLFVLGLLRSHAELLRRTADLERERQEPANTPAPDQMPEGVVPAPETIAQTSVSAIEGLDCTLEPYRLAVADVHEPYLLVAFLSTTCLTCLDIWRDVIEEGDDARRVEAGDDAASLLIVLKAREFENLGKAAGLAAETPVPVVMSGEAWSELDVPGSPYFALIATREQRVVGAGSAQSWEQLRSLAGDGMLELSFAMGASSNGGGGARGGYRSIIEREDDDLRRAGIYPGHPSLTASLLDEEDGAPETPTRESKGDRES
jgi:hypothetical protein